MKMFQKWINFHQLSLNNNCAAAHEQAEVSTFSSRANKLKAHYSNSAVRL